MLDWLNQVVALDVLGDIEVFLENWSTVLVFGFLAIELVRYAVLRKLGWRLAGDNLVNFVTQAFFIGIAYFAVGGFYVATYFTLAEFALFEIETTWLTVIVCIVLADFTYYWEHRFSHRVNIAWATHSVHHSSNHYNISVAYRFGPLDWVWPALFHAPLILAGFDPWLLFFAEFVVLLYQTPLHTEMVGKLPRWIEAVMNTPSHHRVHHASNPEYLDRNYAGMFIIWDRMFGTFAEEKSPITYGLVKRTDSLNPFVVFFHGLGRLARKVATAPTLGAGVRYLVAPPEWEARKR